MMRHPIGASSRSAASLLLLIAAGAAPAPAADYMSAEFMNGRSRPKVVAVLPPHAELIRAKAVMTDQLVKEAQALEDEAASAIAEALKALGYEARVLTPQEAAADPDLLGLLKRFSDRYQEEWSRIARRPRDVRKGRYALGDDAVALAARLTAEGLIVPRVTAVTSSGGRVAMALLLGAGGLPNYARIDLGVVDGKTGRVVSFYIGSVHATFANVTEAPAQVMMKASKATLKKYPDISKVWQVEESDLPAEESAEADDAAIADFEAILEKEKPKEPAPPPEPPPGEKPPIP